MENTNKIRVLESRVKENPHQAEAQFELGKIYLESGKLEAAKKALEMAKRLMPDNPEAWLALGRTYEQLFFMDNALMAYKTAAELNPKLKEANFRLGILYKNLGRSDLALNHFHQVIAVDPDEGDPYYYIGLIYAQLNKWEEAGRYYREALQRIPNNTFARYSLAQALLRQGKAAEAINELQLALSLNPNDLQIQISLGAAYFHAGELSKVVEQFQTILTHNPTEVSAHYYLGAAYFKSGAIDKAIEEYHKAASLKPDSPYAHFSLGATYARGGEHEAAAENFQKAAELVPATETDMSLFATLQLLAATGIEHAQQGKKMQGLYEQLEKVYIETVKALANAIDARDTYTRFHSRRVAQIASFIAQKLGLPPEVVHKIEIGGYLHDVGKIGVPDYYLQKEGRLTEEQRAIIKSHPTIGCNILEGVKFPWDILPMIRHHHERFDGKGYPEGLSGNQIPFEAQIISLADYYDALITDRPYRAALPPQSALEEIIKTKGHHFAPQLVDFFAEVFDEMLLTLEL